MHVNYQPLYRDGCGDDGERLRLVATELAERGWSDDEIRQRVMCDPACVHPAWDDMWVQQEIETCIRKIRPLEPKPAAKAPPISVLDDGLPSWLRARIESMTVPVDPDRYFRETVAALACRGWDRQRIMIEITGRPWVPKCYAAGHGRALEFGVQTILMADVQALARTYDGEGAIEAAPDGLRPPAAVIDAPAVEDALAPWIRDRCERDASSWESSAALFASWTAWAESAGQNAGSRGRFAQALESHGFQAKRMRHGRGFLGLRIIAVEQSR